MHKDRKRKKNLKNKVKLETAQLEKEKAELENKVKLETAQLEKE